MRKIIVGIFVCLLLILSTTTLALTPFRRDEQQTNHRFFDASPIPLPTSGGWMKTFGGTDNDLGYTVLQTIDGGYIIVGETYSFGAGYCDIWVIKTDENGNTVWDKTLGGAKQDYDPNIKQTNDNGFIITAKTYSFGAGENDIWVVKLDENGVEQWNTTFGKPFVDYNGECQQTTDGGYIIVGTINCNESLNFDIWLIKINSTGTEQWNRIFKTAPRSFDFGKSVQQTSDGGYIIAGAYISYGTNTSYDIWLIKTDAQGNEQWNRIYRENSSWKGTCSIEPTSDGGYIVLANRGYYETRQIDFFLMKINQYGDEEWNKTYGGPQDDYCSESYQTSDGGYIIIGYTESFGAGEADVWMIKTDASGNEQWNRTYGGKYNDGGHSIALTNDGGYIITGIKGSSIKDQETYDIWLIKTDSQGKAKTTSDNQDVVNTQKLKISNTPFLRSAYKTCFFGKIHNLTIQENDYQGNDYHFESYNIREFVYWRSSIRAWGFHYDHYVGGHASFGFGGYSFRGILKPTFICGYFYLPLT